MMKKTLATITALLLLPLLAMAQFHLREICWQKYLQGIAYALIVIHYEYSTFFHIAHMCVVLAKYKE